MPSFYAEEFASWPGCACPCPPRLSLDSSLPEVQYRFKPSDLPDDISAPYLRTAQETIVAWELELERGVWDEILSANRQTEPIHPFKTKPSNAGPPVRGWGS